MTMIEWAPSLLLATILFLQWIQVGTSFAFTSISQQHLGADAGIIDCHPTRFLHHHNYQHQNYSRSHRQISSLYSRGSVGGGSINIFSSGSSSNDIKDTDNHIDEDATQSSSSSPLSPSGGIRLNKVFKATHSRREADTLIESGRVCVNGITVEPDNMGMKVLPFRDVVTLDGNVVYGWEAMNAIVDEKKSNKMKTRTQTNHAGNTNTSKDDDDDDDAVAASAADYHHQNHPHPSASSFEYIKFYKPLGVTCTTDSRIKDNIIDSLLHHGYQPRHRIYPVGRLDKETSGLILLTSDGRVVNSVLRGENRHAKVYNVMVNDSLTEEDIQQLRDGIVITTVSQRKGRSIEENTLVAKTKKAIVERIGHNSCRMTLVEGRNRQIRKMMEALGLRVLRLHRVEFMGIRLTPPLPSSSRKEEERGNTRSRRDNNRAAAGGGGLKRPGDWAYLDEREMNLIENAIRLAEEKNENYR